MAGLRDEDRWGLRPDPDNLLARRIIDWVRHAASGRKRAPLLALLALLACLLFTCNRHQEASEEERAYAWDLCNEASRWDVDPATIRDIRLLTHGDPASYENMAESMRSLARAGPNASAALKSLGREVRDFGVQFGRPAESAEEREAFNTHMLALAGERRLELMGSH